MTDVTISPAQYIHAPLINSRSGIALAMSLLAARPKNAGPGVDGAAREMRQAMEALEAVFLAEKSAPAADNRPLDNRCDVVWRAATTRLDGWALLDPERFAESASARRLKDALELNSLAWLSIRYDQQWAEANRRIKYADEHGLVAELDRLAGTAFWAEIVEAHKAYGEALGITVKRPDAPQNIAVAAPLAALAQAIADYALQLVALKATKDAALRAALPAALRPIDEHRARNARTAAPAETPAEPAKPEAPTV